MKNALMILVGIALLAGLFWWMKPAAPVPVPALASSVAAPAQAVDAQAVVAAAAPEPQVFELVVKGKQLVSGPSVISVLQGTPLTLRLTVDHHDELHLHGYDLSLEIDAGKTAELSFVVDRSGRFEYELHHAHLELGALEVQPR